METTAEVTPQRHEHHPRGFRGLQARRDRPERPLRQRIRKEYDCGTDSRRGGGVCQQRGYKLAGFDAKVKSTVLPGSGLSSSAAFEVLIGRILNGLFANGEVSAIEIAQIGQYAENVYYGKPSGLMDQMASSVGGLVFIDFNDPKMPVVEKVDYDFAHCWLYALHHRRRCGSCRPDGRIRGDSSRNETGREVLWQGSFARSG